MRGRHVGSIWKARPTVQEVARDHISYFSSDAGLKALRQVLDAESGAPAGV